MIPQSLDVSMYTDYVKTGSTIGVVTVSSAQFDNKVSFEELALMGGHIEQSRAGNEKASDNRLEIADAIEWTPKLEKKFKRLTQSFVLGELSLAGKLEFERLSSLRRHMKNPRTGEEIIAEYEQRRLTANMLASLQQYVQFHKQYTSNNQRQAA